MNRLAHLVERLTTRPAGVVDGAALMAGIIAKAEQALAGNIGPPADWSHASPAVTAHRERLLEWLQTKAD